MNSIAFENLNVEAIDFNNILISHHGVARYRIKKFIKPDRGYEIKGINGQWLYRCLRFKDLARWLEKDLIKNVTRQGV